MRLVLFTLTMFLLYSCAQDSVTPVPTAVSDALTEPMVCTITIRNIVYSLGQYFSSYSPASGWHLSGDTVIRQWDSSWTQMKGSLANRVFTMHDYNNRITIKLSANYSRIDSLIVSYLTSDTYETSYASVSETHQVIFIARNIPLLERGAQVWRYKVKGEDLVKHIVRFYWLDDKSRASGNGRQYVDHEVFESLSPCSTTMESSIVVELTPQNIWQEAAVRTIKYDMY